MRLIEFLMTSKAWRLTSLIIKMLPIKWQRYIVRELFLQEMEMSHIDQYLVKYKNGTGEECQVGPITNPQLEKFLSTEAPNIIEFEIYKKLTAEEINNKKLSFKQEELFRILSEMRELGMSEGDVTRSALLARRKE